MKIWIDGFFNKETRQQEKEQKEKEQRDQAYLYFINSTALPEIRSGKVWCLYDTYTVFAMEQAGDVQLRTAQCLAELLESVNVGRLLELEKQFRQMSWTYDGTNRVYDWENTEISRAYFSFLDGREYGAVLKFGTFHPNGYFRQRCMETLAGQPGALPYLVLRINDWVIPVREKAAGLVKKQLEVCGISELFQGILCMEKVKRSQRRSEETVRELEDLIRLYLLTHSKDMDFDEIASCETAVRNAIYKMVSSGPVLSQDQMERLLRQEKDGYGKKVLIRGILKQYDIGFSELERYLEDKSVSVKLCAMEYRYERTKDAWPGLKQMLLDRSGKVRSYAAMILRTHTGLQIRDFYVEQLGKMPTAAVILGIGEWGTEQDASPIEGFLVNEKENLAAAAMTAVGKLCGDRMADLYWKYLFDERPSVAARAYRNIKACRIRYGAGCLYEACVTCSDPVTEKYLVNLILKEDSWKRLPFLLRLYQIDNLELRDMIHKKAEKRYPYATLSQMEEAEIRRVLEEMADQLPTDLIRGIDFDLKHVVK